MCYHQDMNETGIQAAGFSPSEAHILAGVLDLIEDFTSLPYVNDATRLKLAALRAEADEIVALAVAEASLNEAT